MAESKEIFRKVTSWTGLTAGALAVIVGLLRIFDSGAKLEWPTEYFAHDVNRPLWRATVFSFAPEVFADVWTPFIMGGLAIAAHFKSWKDFAWWHNSTYLYMLVFHTAMACFGMMGYVGGLGIIFGVAAWLAVLLSLIVYFWCDDNACLELRLPARA
eukprot:Polyplicarium_translucidae@DN2601_c0_g1_i2.p1